MAIPRVRRMVIFKHGVAYLERSGPASGPFELSFKREEMNDVLKSLAVWVAKGEGTIGALAFEKPEDPTIALEERSLNLPLGATMYNLLGAFRGRSVVIESGGTRYEGEVIGLDRDSAGDRGDRTILSLRTHDGMIALVDLSAAKSLELKDEAAKADLAFLIDRMRAATAGTSRSVRVAVTGQAEDVRVSYVIPAPAWRVSYRLARAREPESTTLMAWGIVHNPADEDLEDIELTLTTGQPVSFVIDLYNPKNVDRVVVEETSRAAAAPTSFERAPMAPPRAAAGMPGMTMPAPAPMMAGPAAMRSRASAEMNDYGGSQMMAQAEGASEYADRGELFEYVVGAPVSLKRGGSAMVPLLASKLDAKRERIWRAGTAPSPDLVLTFDNTSGAVLEEGPAVIYDGNVYAGEAMVPYSARGSAIKLAFAKDLGVRCKRTQQGRVVVSGVRLANEALVEEQRRENHHLVTVENDHGEETVVIVELPKNPNQTIDPAGLQPFEETASFRRFRVTAPPRSRAEVTIIERWHDAQRFDYTSLSAANLKRWMADRFLDETTVQALASVVAEWNDAREADTKRARVELDRDAAYEKQSKISEQLGVLKEGGAEGNLRLRYVRELETEQDRVNKREAEMERLAGEAIAARKRAQDKLAAIVATK